MILSALLRDSRKNNVGLLEALWLEKSYYVIAVSA
jgi:hypothetical protein